MNLKKLNDGGVGWRGGRRKDIQKNKRRRREEIYIYGDQEASHGNPRKIDMRPTKL